MVARFRVVTIARVAVPVLRLPVGPVFAGEDAWVPIITRSSSSTTATMPSG
jgi:hypothetical protein